MIPGPFFWQWTTGAAPAGPAEITLAGDVRDISPPVVVRAIDMTPRVSVKTIGPRIL